MALCLHSRLRFHSFGCLPTVTPCFTSQVLYHARIHNGVSKGIKEVCQALERGEAQLVILAEDCDHEDYVKLVTALTAEKGVYLIKVPEKAKLGDWAGAIVPAHAA